MVETFSAYRANDSLHERTLPGRSRRTEDFFDVHHFELFSELVSVNSVAVSLKIFRCAVEWKRFDDLLACPLRRRVCGDVEVQNASAIMRENDKNEQDFKPNGMDGKEVDRGKLGNVIVEERSPCLGWRFWMSDHVFGNGSLRDFNASF